MTQHSRFHPSLRHPLAVGLAVIAALAVSSVAHAGTTSSQVTVPPEYVYKPSAGSYHDYCTMSPDRYERANFQGPCARHDLCMEQRKRPRMACHAALGDDMTTNCRAAYATDGPLRTCLHLAGLYRAAVIAVNPS